MNQFTSLAIVLYLAMLPQHLVVSESLQLVIILPLNGSDNTADPVDGWERGQELLAGAQKAVRTINNSSLLQGYELEVLEINSVRCDSLHYKGTVLPQLINYTVYQQEFDIIGIVGMFCPRTARLVSELANLRKENFNFPLISGSLFPELYDTYKHPNLLHMYNSSLAIMKALADFMNYQHWTRIAIITDKDDTFYSQIAKHFVQFTQTNTTQISISLYLEVHKYFRIPENFEARIVLVSTRLSTARRIICSALEKGHTWPSYAWIFHTHSIDDLFTAPNRCSRLLNESYGIFIIDVYHNSHVYTDSCNTTNPYTNALCKSIQLSALFKNNTLDNPELEFVTFLKNYSQNKPVFDQLTQVLFSSGRVNIVQVNSSMPIIIGWYDSKLGSLTIQNRKLLENDIPSGIRYPFPSVINLTVFYITLTVCFLLVTIDLLLFIYFRKEPEIKATSFSVTIFIFLSCYILIVYLILLALEEQVVKPNTFSTAICIARSWCNNLTLPGPLIMGTILMKMIRIYRIFRPTNLTRIGKCLSDKALTCYILLLQIPNVTTALLWTVIDPYKNTVTYTTKTNFIMVTDVCYSKHLKTWPVLLLCYNIIFAIVLVTVAIKTRNIRKMHFKDTKKVNVYIYLFTLLNTFFLVYWLLTRYTVMNTHSHFILHFGHMVMVVITQLLLFVPKLYPPLKRRVFPKKIYASQSHIKSSVLSLSVITNISWIFPKDNHN